MLFALAALALSPGAKFRPLDLRDPLQDKNFYVLSLLTRNGAVADRLQRDPVLADLSRTKSDTLRSVTNGVTLGKADGLARLAWSPEEIDLVGDELTKLAASDKVVTSFVDNVLRPSHAYYRFETLPNGPFLSQCWREAANGLNNVLDVYGTQVRPGRSAEINGPIYSAKDLLFGGLVKTLLGSIQEEPNRLFFESSLRTAVGLLRAQFRDEAGRHEPLERSENQDAVRAMKKVAWDKYPYAAILVPGYGPEESQVRFSPIGRLGCELAVRRWRAKLAPFILTSGGYVHPNRTPYSEALEMKRCLMQEFGVPESAILVDPHARHTTTNVRNAVRILARDGVPVDKPLLVVTNAFQAADIASSGFEKRCQSVFGYVPYRNARRLSDVEVSLQGNLDSLTLDPMDPLDP